MDAFASIPPPQFCQLSQIYFQWHAFFFCSALSFRPFLPQVVYAPKLGNSISIEWWTERGGCSGVDVLPTATAVPGRSRCRGSPRAASNPL